MADDLTSEYPLPEPEPVFKAVVITDPGPRKIGYIRLLRQVAQLDLASAKALAEKPTPYVLVVCEEQTAEAFRTLAAAEGVACELQDYDQDMQPAIANDQPFELTGTGKGGCGTAVLLLAATGAGLVCTLVLLLMNQ